MLGVFGFSMLSTVTALGTFGSQSNVMIRECRAGVSILAYFIAKTCVEIPTILTRTAAFALMYYALTVPVVALPGYLLVFALLAWVTSGYAHLVSSPPLCLSSKEQNQKSIEVSFIDLLLFVVSLDSSLLAILFSALDRYLYLACLLSLSLSLCAFGTGDSFLS